MRAGTVLLAAAPACAALAAAAIAAPARTTAPSPTRLYQRLLTTAIADTTLPSGFSGAKTSVYAVSSKAKKHRAVGGVEIDLNSGDAEILYLIFPTRADAVADWKDANLKGHSKSTIPAPAGFPWPALISNNSVTGKNVLGQTVTNGVTEIAFTSKNVIVQAATTSVDNKNSGDVVGSIALGRFALKHLQALRK